MNIKNKKILIIIGGGISAYKSLDLIRLLKKNNNEIKTILTKSGKEFVTSLSITTLTKNKTYEDIFDKNTEAEIDHISLSRWADLIIVLPTTANFMTKLSLGKAEDLATTVILASNKDILLVPAMNVRMWIHKATQKNVRNLKIMVICSLVLKKVKWLVVNMVMVKCLVQNKFFLILKIILIKEIW